MALCNTVLKGIELSCDASIGGIDTFWIATYDDVHGSISIDESNLVDAVDSKGGNHFKQYQCRQETSTVTWAGVEGTGKSIAYWNYSVTIVIDKHDSTKSLEVESLSKEPLVLIFRDGNGKRWLLGDVRGARLSPSTAGDFGTAYTDANQYTLVFECASPHLAYELKSSTEINPSQQ